MRTLGRRRREFLVLETRTGRGGNRGDSGWDPPQSPARGRGKVGKPAQILGKAQKCSGGKPRKEVLLEKQDKSTAILQYKHECV